MWPAESFVTKQKQTFITRGIKVAQKSKPGGKAARVKNNCRRIILDGDRSNVQTSNHQDRPPNKKKY